MDTVQIIEELESIASTATRVPGLRNRAIVDIDRLISAAEELGGSIPSDMQEAQEVLRQKDSIINGAHLEARRLKEAAEQESRTIIAASHEEHETRVDDTKIVRAAEAKGEEIKQQALQEAQEIAQDAQQRAYRVIDEAEAAASTRREGAGQYARETLFDLEERLASQLGQVRRGIDSLGLEVEAGIPS